MFYPVKHTVSFARENLVHFLRLWYAQLDAWERLCTIPVQAAAALQEHTLKRRNARAPSKEVSPVLLADGDLHVAKLHGHWRDMYDAAVLYEAAGETQPVLAKLVQSCSDDFNYCLAAARTADECLANSAPASIEQKGN